MPRRIFVAVAMALLLAACKQPSLDEVRDAYKAQHRGYVVLAVDHGDLKDPPNSYRVKFRRPGDPTVHTELWRYDPVKRTEPAPVKDSAAAKPDGKPGDAPRPPI
jgi:hypothetical protein